MSEASKLCFFPIKDLTLLTFPLWEAKNASGRGNVNNKTFSDSLSHGAMLTNRQEIERHRDRQTDRQREKERKEMA